MIIEDFLQLFKRKEPKISGSEIWCTTNIGYDEVGLIQYAYALCVQIVGNLVSACEKKTFKQGEQVEEKLYYQLNLEPNPVQTANEFWKSVIREIFYNGGEALIVEIGGSYYVASNFATDVRAITGNIYRDVYVEDVKVRKNNGVFKESEVIHIDCTDFLKAMALKSGGFYADVLRIITKQYLKKKYDKAIFEIPGVAPVNPIGSRDSDRKRVMQENVKEFMNAERDVSLVVDGEIKVGKYESTMGEGYTDDAPNILSFGDNTMQAIANMFSLPLEALKGLDVSLNTHIKLFLNPLLQNIEQEINRKRFNQYSFLKGSRVRISTVNIEKTTAEERAKTNDLKLRSGIFSINEIRADEGLEKLEEKWADSHFMTLNYDVIDKFMTGSQGSGNSNKNSPVQGEEENTEDAKIYKELTDQ